KDIARARIVAMTYNGFPARLVSARAGDPRLLANLSWCSTSGGNNPEVAVAPWTTRVHDVLTVGRPARVFVIILRGRQLFLCPRPEVDGKDLFMARAGGTEYEHGAIRRPLRLEIIGRILRDLRP